MTAVLVAVTVLVSDEDPALCSNNCPYKSPRISLSKPLSATCNLFAAPIEYAEQDDDTDYTALRCQACLDGAEHRPVEG